MPEKLSPKRIAQTVLLVASVAIAGNTAWAQPEAQNDKALGPQLVDILPPGSLDRTPSLVESPQKGSQRFSTQLSDSTWRRFYDTSGTRSVYAGSSYSEQNSSVALVDYSSAAQASLQRKIATASFPMWHTAVTVSKKDPNKIAVAITNPFMPFPDIVSNSEDGGQTWRMTGFGGEDAATQGSIVYTTDDRSIFTLPSSPNRDGFRIKQTDPKGVESYHVYKLNLTDTDWAYQLTSPHLENGVYKAAVLTLRGWEELTFKDGLAYAIPHLEFPYGYRIYQTKEGEEYSQVILNSQVITGVSPNPRELPYGIKTIGTRIKYEKGFYEYLQPSLNLEGYQKELLKPGPKKVGMYAQAIDQLSNTTALGITIEEYSQGKRKTHPFVEIVAADGSRRLLSSDQFPQEGFVDDVSLIRTPDGQQLVRALINSDELHPTSTLVEIFTNNQQWQSVSRLTRAQNLVLSLRRN